jgi:hypothetical protein
MTYEEKYAGVDLKSVCPSTINDPDECLWMMEQLDQIMARITAQLDHAHAAVRTRGEYADPAWYANAKLALKIAKSTRNAFCHRVGVLKRSSSSKPRTESAFMDAARRRLDPATFNAILADARAATDV